MIPSFKANALTIKILSVLVVVLVAVITYMLYVFYVAYDQMPETSCLHLSTSYWNRAKRIVDSTNLPKDKEDTLIQRYMYISGEIETLCQLDFTSDKAFHEYPSSSQLLQYMKK